MIGVATNPDENPVLRIPVVCTDHDVKVYIDPIQQVETEGDNGNVNASNINGDSSGSIIHDRVLRYQLRALQSRLISSKGTLEEMDE